MVRNYLVNEHENSINIKDPEVSTNPTVDVDRYVFQKKKQIKIVKGLKVLTAKKGWR